MPIDVLIARWVAIFWLIYGLSHALHPRLWSELLVPMREREAGGFILASMQLPVSLLIILGHNIWVWDVPVIITIAAWLSGIKCITYLLFPNAHRAVMKSTERVERGLRTVGIVMIVLGAVTAYDAFFLR